jgi:RimJ/RimL family protein N-acetyltransferase
MARRPPLHVESQETMIIGVPVSRLTRAKFVDFLTSNAEPAVTMSTAAFYYSSEEVLRDGGSIHVRAIRPDDKERLREFSQHLSPKSVYFRFFSPRKGLSERELAFLTELDFERHVAIVATVGRGGEERIIGVGRYVVPKTEPDPPRTAEIAFVVLDEHQGRGIASKLLAHLLIIAHEKGLREFSADVLPDNQAMLRVFAKSGLHARRKVESGVVHLSFPTEETPL